MANAEELGLARQIRQEISEVVYYPFNHPIKTAKVAAVGALAVVGSVLTAQASMILAEHGSEVFRRSQYERS